MARIEIVSKDEIPRRRGGRPRSDITEFLEKLLILDAGDCIQITEETIKEANAWKSRLLYYQNNRHRPGTPWYPNLMITQRKNVVYCWLEREG